MKIQLLYLGLILLFLKNTLSAQALEKVDLNLISSCIACHGQDGISPNDEWPNLAGQKKTYLINQLKNFKHGQRVNVLMTPISKMLDEHQIEALANYYSNLGLDK